MSDYVICVRNIEKNKFGTEPGETRFLEIPGQVKTMKTSQVTEKKKDWFKKVMAEAVVEKNPETGQDRGDILVFIHGYNNDQKIVLKRHRALKKSLSQAGYEGTVVSFDWPSANSALNYLEDRSDAKKTAIKLVDDCIKAFSIMQEQDCEINVHLLAHSTGAYVVREAFDDADDRPKIAGTNWTTSQILFIGADVSSGSMSIDNAKSSSIYRHCARLTNYSNPYDSVLKLSNVKRVGVAPRVGRIGLPTDIPRKAVNVNCGPYYAANKDSIEAIGTHDHSWHIGNPVFTKDMLFTITGDIDRNSIPTRALKDGQLFLVSD